MSIAVMQWVWNHSKAKNADRLVMLAIADCCRFDNGTGAFPSVAELSRKTLLGDRTVRACLRSLEQSGELVVESAAGPRGCNRYRVSMVTPAESASPLQNQQGSGEEEAFSLLIPGDPAESAPPADSAPLQNTAVTPADSAPGTVRNRKNPINDPAVNEDRATRLPKDWTPTADMLAWVKTECPDLDEPYETDQFCIYWWNKPGKDGRKISWSMTWKGQMRRQQKRAVQFKQSRFVKERSNAPTPIRSSEMCTEHRGQRKGACRDCAARAKGGMVA